MKTSYDSEIDNEFVTSLEKELPNNSECVMTDENQQSECVSSVSSDILADNECTSNYFALVSSLCVQRSMAVISEVDSGPSDIPNEDISQSSLPAVPAVPPRVPKRVINTEETKSLPTIPQEIIHESSNHPEELNNRASVNREEVFNKASVNAEEEILRTSMILDEVSRRISMNVEEVIQRPAILEAVINNQRLSDVANELWSDTICQVPTADDETVASDTDGGPVPCEPTSEMYYTASSEISLVSDEMPDKMHEEDSKEKKECVTAGHVAAMRERFESMTRTNTPDFLRSSSPSMDVLRNITPSPDQLE